MLPRPVNVAIHWSVALVIVFVGVACGLRPAAPPAAWVGDDVMNYHRIENGLATANTITVAALPKLLEAGFKTIIDLRSPTESGVAEEAAAAEHIGLRYVNIPVTLVTLSPESVRKVAEALDRSANRPVLVHCATGNRVGAVMELYREAIHGVAHEAARNEARAIGLQAPEMIEAVERVRHQMESGR